MTVCLIDKEKGETIEFTGVKRIISTTLIGESALSVYFGGGKRLIFSQSAYELLAVFN